MTIADKLTAECAQTVEEMSEVLKGLDAEKQSYLQGVLAGIRAIAPAFPK